MDRAEDDAEPELLLRLPNALSAVEDSRLAVARFLEPFGLSSSALNRVEVVLEELVSNLVRHGKDVSGLSVAAGVRDGAVDLVVEDDGREFDPFSVPEPEAFTTLEKAQLGGLGIPLVRRLSDAARYDRVGSGETARNRVSVSISCA